MSIPKNITKEHLLKAISKINEEGIPKGSDSQYYDVIFEGKRYPPKLIVSLANVYANGHILDRNTFYGGENTECFRLLTSQGFLIRKKEMTYFNELLKFLAQSKIDDLRTKHFAPSYNDTEVKVSFGQGNTARIPWISFLIKPNTTSNGIYPVYLYFKKYEVLILAYGISETNKPSISWDRENLKKISDYFEETGMGKPERYGDSFIYKIYDVNNLPSGKEMDNDLNAIIEIYKMIDTNNSEVENGSFRIDLLARQIEDSGLLFSNALLSRFVASLLTKPFVILTGLSGSGKTKLAQAFVQWICKDKSQYRIVPVGADWTNREPLLGFPNGLESDKYVSPESGVLKLIEDANTFENQPYFLILDEMNLSHVERYFADFLSVMESGDTIKLYSDDTRYDKPKNAVSKELRWPRNLFIIGTVNIDETTYMFSPKVLDRANVIEFRISKAEMSEFLIKTKPLQMEKLYLNENKDLGGAGQHMAEGFLEMARVNKPNNGIKNDILIKFFAELQVVGAEFGYRCASEIDLLLSRLSEESLKIDKGLSLESRIDIAIMQKLLPKLHGSRKKLVEPLETLAGFCLKQKSTKVEIEKGKSIYQTYLSDNKDESRWEIIYPISLEKIERMHKNVIENGFTSYAEA